MSFIVYIYIYVHIWITLMKGLGRIFFASVIGISMFFHLYPMGLPAVEFLHFDKTYKTI